MLIADNAKTQTITTTMQHLWQYLSVHTIFSYIQGKNQMLCLKDMAENREFYITLPKIVIIEIFPNFVHTSCKKNKKCLSPEQSTL